MSINFTKLLILNLLAITFFTGCGTKVGIVIEKALGVTDFISIVNSPKYTNQNNININLKSLNQFYAFSTNLAACNATKPENPMFLEINLDPALSPITAPNDDNTYYVRFASSDGSDSGCLSTSVLHDNLAPNAAIVYPDSNVTAVSLPTDSAHVAPEISWLDVLDDSSAPSGKFSGIDYYKLSIYEYNTSTLIRSASPVIEKTITFSFWRYLASLVGMGFSESLSYNDSTSDHRGYTQFNMGNTYLAVVVAYDKAGNKSAEAVSTTWSLDKTAPETSYIKITSNDITQVGPTCSTNALSLSPKMTFATSSSNSGLPSTIEIKALDPADSTTLLPGSGLDYVSVSVVDITNPASPITIINNIKISNTLFNASGVAQNIDLKSLATAQSITIPALTNNHIYSLQALAYDKAGNFPKTAAGLPSPLDSSSASNIANSGVTNQIWLFDSAKPAWTPSTLPQNIADSNLTVFPGLASPPVAADAEGLLNFSDLEIIDSANSTLKYTLTSNLPGDRKYKIIAAAEDCVGNQTTQISSNDWCVDTTNPTYPSIGTIADSAGGAATYAITTVNGSDAIPIGGNCASGIAGYHYQLVKSNVQSGLAAASASTPMATPGANDITAFGTLDATVGSKSIDITSLSTGYYFAMVTVIDKVGNKSTSVSSNAIYITNLPPDCSVTTMTLSEAKNLSSVVVADFTAGVGASVAGASKTKTHTVELDYSAVTCQRSTADTTPLTTSEYSVEVYDSSNTLVSVSSPIQRTMTSYSATVNTALTSGTKYHFVLTAKVTGSSLKTPISSPEWLVDSDAPSTPSLSVQVASKYMKDATSSPTLNLPTPLTDLPVSNNVGVKNTTVEIYKSNISGVAAGSVPDGSTTILGNMNSSALINTLTLLDGNFYTAKVKATDNLSQVGVNSAATAFTVSPTSTWLVDLTSPEIKLSWVKNNLIKYNFTTKKIDLSLQALTYSFTGVDMMKDPIPVGGVAASGLDNSTYKVFLYLKSDVNLSSAPLSLTGTPSSKASYTVSSSDFSSTSISLDASNTGALPNGVYRAAFQVTDLAGNISNIFIDSTDISIIRNGPNCSGSLSLIANSTINTPPKYTFIPSIAGIDIEANSTVASPDLRFDSLTCTDALGNAATSLQIEVTPEGSSTIKTVTGVTYPPAANFNTAGLSLSSGTKYNFIVKAVDINGTVSVVTDSIKSNFWLVDSDVPNKVLNPTFSNQYSNISQSASQFPPQLNITNPTDLPASNNSGLQKFKIEYWNSTAVGAQSSLVTTLNTNIAVAANISGTTTFIPTSTDINSGTFVDGKYYTAKIYSVDNLNQASSENAVSSSFRWLVDITAPTFAATPYTAGSYKYNTATNKVEISFPAIGSIVNDTSAFTPSGIDAATLKIIFAKASDSTVVTQSEGDSFTASSTKLSTLPNGVYKVKLQAADKAGNISSFDLPNMTVASAAPICTLVNGSNPAFTFNVINGAQDKLYTDGSGNNGFALPSTANSTPWIDWSNVSCVSNGDSSIPLTYKVEVGTTSTFTTGSSFSIAAGTSASNLSPFTATQGTGYYTRLLATDPNGRVSSPIYSSTYFFMDTTPPTLPVVTVGSALTYLNSTSTTFATEAPVISWTSSTEQPATNNVSGVAYTAYIYDVNASYVNTGGSPLKATISSANSPLNYTAGSSIFADGHYYTAVVKSMDTFGSASLASNISAESARSATTSWMVDRTSPAGAAISSVVYNGTGSNLSFTYTAGVDKAPGNVTCGSTPGLFCSGISSTYDVFIHTGSDYTSAIAGEKGTISGVSGNFSQSISSLSLAGGKVYNVDIKYYDKAGNSTTSTNLGSFTIPLSPTLTLQASTAGVNIITSNRSAFPLKGLCSASFNGSTSYNIYFKITKFIGGTVVGNNIPGQPAVSTVGIPTGVTCNGTTLNGGSDFNFNFSNATLTTDADYIVTAHLYHGSTAGDDWNLTATSSITLSLTSKPKVTTFTFATIPLKGSGNGNGGLVSSSNLNSATLAKRYYIDSSSISTSFPFTGTCNMEGDVVLRVTENGNTSITGAIGLTSTLGKITNNPNSSADPISPDPNRLHCQSNGSGGFEFSGELSFSGLQYGTTIEAVLVDYNTTRLTNLANASTYTPAYAYAFVDAYYIPWVGEKSGSMTLAIPSTSIFDPNDVVYDIDSWPSTKSSPNLYWPNVYYKNLNGDIVPITSFKVFLVVDGSGALPTAVTDFNNSTSYDWYSVGINGSSNSSVSNKSGVAVASMSINNQIFGTNTMQFKSSTNFYSNYSEYKTCIAGGYLDTDGQNHYTNVVCSDGFIPTTAPCPIDFELVVSDTVGVADFCVSKFEMSYSKIFASGGNIVRPASTVKSTTIGELLSPLDSNFNNDPVINAAGISRTGCTSWDGTSGCPVQSDSNENKDPAIVAKELCQNMGTDYSIINWDQWNTIARSIASRADNKISGNYKRGLSSISTIAPDLSDDSRSFYLNDSNYVKGIIYDFSGNLQEVMNIEFVRYDLTNVTVPYRTSTALNLPPLAVWQGHMSMPINYWPYVSSSYCPSSYFAFGCSGSLDALYSPPGAVKAPLVGYYFDRSSTTIDANLGSFIESFVNPGNYYAPFVVRGNNGIFSSTTSIKFQTNSYLKKTGFRCVSTKNPAPYNGM